MKVLFSLFCLMLCVALFSCTDVTMLRTKEIKEATDISTTSINRRIDSLMQVIDSLKLEQARNMARLKADFSELYSKINEQGEVSQSRMEEISFRLERILGAVQQRSVVTKSAPSSEKNAEPVSQEMETLYNASRADYLRAEYVEAYNGFKQIYESLKTGEMAENSLYWMGMCMLDANKKGNAETLFKSLLEKYPQSAKVCTVNFKLASMAEESKHKSAQKAYLEKLLNTKHCISSNEFQRAAEILPTLN